MPASLFNHKVRSFCVPNRLLSCLIFIFGTVALSACQKNDAAKQPTNPQASQTTPASQANPSSQALAKDEIQLLASDILSTKAESYQPSVIVTGTLQVANKTNVQAVVNSQANGVLVKVGSPVKKGQPLVTLNLEDSQNKLAQAQADVLAAQAQANVARTLAEKNRILLDKGFVAQIEYQRSLADAQAQQQGVQAKQAQLNIAKKMYGDMTIIAPMSGVIASRNIEVGQLVTAGQTLMQIIDPSQLEFAASVPNEAQGQIAIGQTVPFTLNSSNADSKNSPHYSGKVSRIAPEVDATTRQMMIYISVNPADAKQLRAGMFATGQIPYGQSQNGILVPSNAVLPSDSQSQTSPASPPSQNTAEGMNSALEKGSIWVIDSSQRLLKQPITLVKRYDNTNQILIQGIEAGSKVVLVPLSADDAGKKVVIKS